LAGTFARKENGMERTYESAAALVDRATGPLARHLGLFVTSLISRQYAASVIYIKALHALAFDRWLAKRRVVLSDLGEVYLERYRHRRHLRYMTLATALGFPSENLSMNSKRSTPLLSVSTPISKLFAKSTCHRRRIAPRIRRALM
jgi:hypothetical protein